MKAPKSEDCPAVVLRTGGYGIGSCGKKMEDRKHYVATKIDEGDIYIEGFKKPWKAEFFTLCQSLAPDGAGEEI